MAVAVTLAASAPPAGGQGQRAEIRLAALTAAAAADALDDLQAVDDPDAAGVRTGFRNATRHALEAASKAYDSSPTLATPAFDLSLDAAEAAERFGDAFTSALEARGELEGVIPEAVQAQTALDEARRADSIFRAAQIAREAVLAELRCHQADGCPPPLLRGMVAHDSAPMRLMDASWLAVKAAQLGNVPAAQAAHSAVLAEVAGDHAAADAARADLLVAFGVSPDVAQAALDAYLTLEGDASRCSSAPDTVLPARKVRGALDREASEIGNQILRHWEFDNCNQRIWRELDVEQCRQARASGESWKINLHCEGASNADGLLGQLDAKRDRDRKARARQSSIDTAQTLRLATVEALLEVQAEVGNLDVVVDVLSEGASVARDRGVEATVSAASAVREAETHLDEAIRAYRRAAAAWRALLAQ